MKDKAKSKERLDNLLVARAMFPSRESARTAIMDGAILVNGQKVTKAGTAIAEDATIEIIKSYNLCPYVSRGGLKLERALKHFQVVPAERIAIDAGASTGGFTDCLLKNGAALVYAIDVGYGQLDWSLRQDSRVKVLERVNIRNLKDSYLYRNGEKKADLAVMDVSFISVTKTLPALIALLDASACELVVLIKPQFEAGRGKVGKGGVVRDIEVHIEVLDKVISFIQSLGVFKIELTYSPIKGPSGNIEYLLHLLGGQTIDAPTISASALAEEKAREAFASLGAP
ncbi:MAG: TlyA family RNA methyltransferase [Cyanobacteria bacterium SZAS TMP-1]|nr:TlyA family RNA methyltransferase [Cyanobacteria bacterium SZAS TMP-1]